jgi:hypothetical protein
MAFAGTPTGLAQQAGTSHPWKALLAAIAVLAVGLAMVIAVLFVNSQAIAPAVDTSYNQIEAQRGARTFGAAAVDRSQDQIEAQRGAAAVDANAVEEAAAAKARAMSGVAAPLKVYQLDERPRGSISHSVVKNGRGARLRTGSALDATTLDRIYEEIQSSRGAHGPLR